MQPKTDSHPDDSDPLIDEVRAVRQQLWDACGHDMKSHLQQLRAVENEFADRLVSKETLRAGQQSAKQATH